MTPTSELSQLFNITGLVVSLAMLESGYKDEALNDEEASSYRPSKKCRSEMVMSNSQKCQVTIRDSKYADTLTCYVISKVVSQVTEGLFISISNCKLCVSQGKKKKLYFILNSDRNKKSSVGKLLLVKFIRINPCRNSS